MGSRGPKPASNHLKILKGVQESRINRDEPVPGDASGIVAPDMSEGARRVWDRLAPDLIDKGCLTPWDVDTFAVFCNAVAVYHDCREKMGVQYTDRGAAGGVIKSPFWQIMRDCSDIMAKYSGKFGLTPGDRADLKVGGGDGGPRLGAERILGG